MPLGAATPFPNPAYLKLIMKAMISNMSGAVGTTGEDNIHTIVYWVKSMREMRYLLFLKEKDAKVLEQ